MGEPRRWKPRPRLRTPPRPVSVSVTHRFTNNVYMGSTVEVTTGAGSFTAGVTRQGSAEGFGAFLDTLARVRPDPYVPLPDGETTHLSGGLLFALAAGAFSVVALLVLLWLRA